MSACILRIIICSMVCYNWIEKKIDWKVWIVKFSFMVLTVTGEASLTVLVQLKTTLRDGTKHVDKQCTWNMHVCVTLLNFNCKINTVIWDIVMHNYIAIVSSVNLHSILSLYFLWYCSCGIQSKSIFSAVFSDLLSSWVSVAGILFQKLYCFLA